MSQNWKEIKKFLRKDPTYQEKNANNGLRNNINEIKYESKLFKKN